MSGTGGESGTFNNAPLRLQVWFTVAILAAAALPFMPAADAHRLSGMEQVLVAALLVIASVVSVELGRVLEGRLRVGQRPHKGLSAWAIASALLLPQPWLLIVIAGSYLHARQRGLEVPLYKWVTSGAYLVLAGLAAAAAAGTLPRIQGAATDAGLITLLHLLAAVAVFLLVETVLLTGSAYLGLARNEVWLRRTLADPSFYLLEGSVLSFGTLIGLLGATAPWTVILLIPTFGVMQRAVLHQPLRDQADHDSKTGLLRYEPWRNHVRDQIARMTRAGQPFAVLLLDLDHFKDINDTCGHLAGDQVLAATARTLRETLRDGDLIARFGGEEFIILLTDTTDEEARLITERLCQQVRDLVVPGIPQRVTISIGAATSTGDDVTVELITAISTADRALYAAKSAGRDRTVITALSADRPDAPDWVDER